MKKENKKMTKFLIAFIHYNDLVNVTDRSYRTSSCIVELEQEEITENNFEKIKKLVEKQAVSHFDNKLKNMLEGEACKVERILAITKLYEEQR